MIWFIYGLCCCKGNIKTAESTGMLPEIFPDYVDVTIPVNIAPLNFGLQDGSDRLEIHFMRDGQVLLKCKGNNHISIPLKAWHRMLHDVAGSDVQALVYARKSGRWHVYQPFNIHVANDSIDPYIAYRLLDPAYEIWDKMGIYQRKLSNFEESAIILNSLTNRSCVNCHSFHNYDPDRMMFHSRGEKSGGTFLFAGGKQQRINTKTKSASSAGSYPVWHPSGDYIAFSTNTTRQSFHALPGQKIQVYDLDSNLAVWDVKNGLMLRDRRFTTKETWENFPEWSPDGRWLYYTFAGEKSMPFESKQLIYGLCRVDFDAETGRFGEKIDTIVHPASGKSVSFPRLSPDGNYLLYNVTDYATSIWHSNADLEMMDLRDGKEVDIRSVNSNETESYHAWSSNGRWIVFSSRRMDGWYARLFFAYFDESGKMHKPFLLPQKDPMYNTKLLMAYNVPEFIKGKVTLNSYDISRTLNGEMIELDEMTSEK